MSGTSDAEAAALLVLSSIEGIGPAALLEVHRGVGAEAGLEAVRAGRSADLPAIADRLARSGRWNAAVDAARSIDADALLGAHRRHGHLWVLDRDGYPPRLALDPAPPVVVFGRGDPDAMAGPTAAIVGTRAATGLGRDLAVAMGRDLSLAGVAVVSGLAVGIDAAAHRGAIEGCRDGGAGPIGIVASGLDIAYPRRHLALHREVADLGLLLGETVLGERPSRWRFPARNRIIAGLADAVVVVESRASGGSIHTAEEALGRGVPLLAVPGHPLGPVAEGTNDLLAEGAGVARHASDVLDAIGMVVPEGFGGAAGATLPPVPDRGAAGAILRVLADGPASLSEIVERTHESFEELSVSLVELEADGRVGREGTWFELRTGPGTLRRRPRGHPGPE